MSLLSDLASHTSSHKDITEDVHASADQPAPFIHSCEFEVGEDLKSAGELDMSITLDVEYHESEAIYLHESREEKVESSIFELDDAILYVEIFFMWVDIKVLIKVLC